MNVNPIQLKVLLLDSITRIKYGGSNPLVANHQNGLRRALKKEAGLRSNCDEADVLTIIAATYEEVGQLESFIKTMKRFGLQDWIQLA